MSTGRSYDSSLRQERARQTRLRIRRTARTLFAEHGFVDTTIADIARSAGVSPATVYNAFESKAGIVTAMLDELESVLADTPQPIAPPADHPDEQLRDWVAAHCRLFAAGADILRASVEAAGTPEVTALMVRGDAHRRASVDELARRWADRGALAAGLDATTAAETMWLLSTVDSFLTATDRLGWSVERYERWLGDLLTHRVLRGG